MAAAATTIPAGVSSAAQEKAAAGPLQTPLPQPTPESKPTPAEPLTEDQQKKYDWLLAQIKSWTEIKATKEGKTGPLRDSDRFWLTRQCILRFLRATEWKEAESEKRLLTTLAWRRDYGIGIDEELTPEYISPEQETGKQCLVGYDKEGRPCHYLNPGRQNTEPSPRQTQHLVFMLERAIELMPPGQEKVALLVNFKQSKSRSNTAPGIGQGREVLNILQTHYPERLGRALIINGNSRTFCLFPAPLLTLNSPLGRLGLLQAHHPLHPPPDAREAQVQRGHAPVRAQGAARHRVQRRRSCV